MARTESGILEGNGGGGEPMASVAPFGPSCNASLFFSSEIRNFSACLFETFSFRLTLHRTRVQR